MPAQRQNIAERLYRVTGEGIYRDSRLLGLDHPLAGVELPQGGVFGQDSVVNAVYRGKLYWFWGDTLAGDRSLGNFRVARAVSSLPDGADNQADYSIDRGISLNYFTGNDGFSRSMVDIPGPASCGSQDRSPSPTPVGRKSCWRITPG